MVKKISKFIAYSIFFILAIIIFAPKPSAYFLMEKNLKNFGIVISDERLEDKSFSLNIENLNLSIKGIDSARIKKAEITFLLLFNSVELEEIELSSLVNSFVPAKIDRVKVSYTLFNPLVLNMSGVGQFGKANAGVNLLKREIKVVLKPSQKMLRAYQNSLRSFKKDANGEYIYVKTF